MSGTGTGDKAHPDPAIPSLSSLVAALPGPLLVIDAEDRIALASPNAEGLFGRASGALVGCQAADLFPDGFDRTPARALHRSGGTLRVAVSRRRLEHADAALELLWLQDVTERGSEESLRRHLRDLERATRAKSDLVATMSHEIRTPVSAVLGMTEILLDSNLDRDQREIAERVRRAGANLLTTLNDLLDLAKMEAGRMDLTTSSFAIRPWLREVLDLFHTEAEAKSLALNPVVSSQVPATVHGDAPRLRQILVNLVGNAVKFTHRGGITITADRCPVTDDLLFSVRDSGIGIEADHLDHLFEPWAQAGAAAGEHGGAGLGLAIARRFVEHMGGSIDASSEPGEGSEFRFRVPQTERRRLHAEPVQAEPGDGDPALTQSRA